MNREKPYFLKRSIAYLIDLIIVSLLASLITLIFIGNNTKNVNYTTELLSLRDQLSKKEITEEAYIEKSNDLTYLNSKSNVGMTLTVVGVSLVYYVILCYFCNGITLGKYLMKLQIVSNKDKKLNMLNYLIRGLLINLILMYTLDSVLVLTLNKESFVAVYSIISYVLTLFLLATLLFVMYREDGRGLHDIIAGTKIISTKELKVKENIPEEVVEAKVIEEKKTVKKESKPKKSTKKVGGKK